MKMKYKKTAAELLVACAFADYWKSTSTEEGKVVAYWVCWFDEFKMDAPDDECELVSMKNGYAFKQVFALEDYFAWNETELWEESVRWTFRPLSAGQYSLQKRRLDRIKWCLKEITKRLED